MRIKFSLANKLIRILNEKDITECYLAFNIILIKLWLRQFNKDTTDTINVTGSAKPSTFILSSILRNTSHYKKTDLVLALVMLV